MKPKHLNKQETLAVSRYLERYAEPLVSDIDHYVINAFRVAIVIPVYDETEAQMLRFLDYQKSAEHREAVLMIWVFNAPERAKGSPALLRTQQVFERMLKNTHAHKISEHIHISTSVSSHTVLFVERCYEHLLPDKQGVGLARKLGMDLALKLAYQQYVATQHWCCWIHSTDADVVLPNDYGLVEEKEAVTACIYPFKHDPEKGFERAMLEYEFSLHYYVAALREAGSPYAFHTIGSLIVVSSIAYAQVRGMPKRSGAEDFYVLNKLAKLGAIECLKEPSIKVSGRPSHRVPFGTGPALLKIQSQHEQSESLRVYHPRIFFLLKCVLDSVAEVDMAAEVEEVDILARLHQKLPNSTESKGVVEVLFRLGWLKQLEHLKKLKSIEAMQHAFHTWFDAFITLRFIHEIRDTLYPTITLTALPEQLDKPLNRMIRGTELDYTEWFKALGI